MVKQSPVTIVLVLACTVMAACGTAPEASGPPEQAPSKKPTASSDVLRFTREESGRRQSLELRKRDGGAFDVAISVAGACSRDETGTAKAVKTEGDGDVEVDPDGEGHPTDDFTLSAQGKCRVTIRLAAPERDFAWVRESGCSTSCALTSKAMTRKP